jgi:hypothetical protein
LGLRRDHFRMLGNGYCARPIELDRAFESICETCTFFQTSIQFRPTPQAQHDDAEAKHQSGREQMFQRLLHTIDRDASRPAASCASSHPTSYPHHESTTTACGSYDAIETLARLRTPYWLGDSSVQLHALASLLAQAEQLLPEAVHDACDQELTWAPDRATAQHHRRHRGPPLRNA